MGNQASLGQAYQMATAASAVSHPANAEPLEAFSKEKQRDEHLKNLGFKRTKSLRKSISKRLRRKRAHKDDAAAAAPATEAAVVEVAVEQPRRVPSIERLDRGEFEEREKKRPLVGEMQPLPTHVQVRLVGSDWTLNSLKRSFFPGMAVFVEIGRVFIRAASCTVDAVVQAPDEHILQMSLNQGPPARPAALYDPVSKEGFRFTCRILHWHSENVLH